MRRPAIRGRSGVSPMVSDVMLTSIVVVSMAILLAWASWYAYSNPSKMAVKERFFVEDVWFNGTSTMGIYIYNFGKVSVTINRIYINGTDFTDYSFTDSSPLSSNPLYLRPGEGGRIDVKFPGGFQPGAPQRVRVVSSRGAYVEVVAVASW